MPKASAHLSNPRCFSLQTEAFMLFIRNQEKRTVKTLPQLRCVKTMPKRSILKRIFMSFALIVMTTIMACAQGTGFNFQGRLNDGTSPANGRYDLQFRLFDAVAGGNPIGSLVSRPNTILINGVFSVTLDFGAAAFNSPNSVFIEIGIRPNGSPNAFTILGPRQQLTVVPFAVSAANATWADNALHALDATNAGTAVSATTAINAENFGFVPPSGYAKLNVINTGDLRTTGSLAITGDAFQPITANGLVKAMMQVSPQGSILRCFNGIANLSAGDCGFLVTQPLGNVAGIYRINFGFPISNRFIAVSAEYGRFGNSQNNNGGANYRAFDSTSMEVFTFDANSVDTFGRSFTIIVF
jgi:hypothetical protein